MLNRKLFGPQRIDSVDGTEAIVRLNPARGGAQTKNVQYWMRVTQKSSDDVRLGMDLEDGPDGRNFIIHTANVINSWDPPAVPSLTAGDATDSTRMIGEWLLPSLKIKHNTSSAAVWAVVEVWELRKPF